MKEMKIVIGQLNNYMETKKSNTYKPLSKKEIFLFILYLCGVIISTSPLWYNFYCFLIK